MFCLVPNGDGACVPSGTQSLVLSGTAIARKSLAPNRLESGRDFSNFFLPNSV